MKTVSRAWKIFWIVGALAAVQAGLFVAYRSAKPADERRFVTEAVAAAPAPVLSVDVRGEKRVLASLGQPTLIHFWATWCKPCREELPELLDLAGESRQLGVHVVAVSVDETWEVIDHYFGGRAPSAVVRASHEDAQRAFSLGTLPASFLVDAEGRIRHRLPGAQPWATAQARAWFASARDGAR